MRAAIYARFSSDNQREESIDAQIRAIKEYSQRNGYEVVKNYIDEARTATTDDRPKFLQMIKDSELDIFDIVVVHKLDRFARNRYDSAFYKRLLKRNGVRLISVLEQLDDSPESVILESVLEGMAEYYSKNLAREVMKGMKENALKAKHNGGTPCLGYTIVDSSYVIVPEEARIVQYIFERYSSGIGYKTLIQELKEKGYKTKRGNDFTQTSVHDILRNERYTGCYIFNKQASKDAYGKRNQHKYKNEDEIIKIPGGMPQIISEELFNNIKWRMDGRMNGRYKAKINYLLSGKIFCGNCGAALIGHTSHNKGYTYCSYQCGTRYRTKNCNLKAVKKEYVEGKVIENLKLTIFNLQSIKQLTSSLIEHYNKLREEDAEDIKLLDYKLSDIQKKIDNMMAAVADGFYNPSMKTSLSNLEEEKETVTNAMNDIKRKLNLSTLNEELIEKYLVRDMERLESDDPIALKEIINTYVNKVIVYDNKIDTQLRVPEKVVHSTGAGNGNRTRIAGLGSRNSTIELYLHLHYLLYTFFKIFQLHLIEYSIAIHL